MAAEGGYVLLYISEELRNDRDFAVAALRENVAAVQYFSKELIRNVKAIAMVAVKQGELNLKECSLELRNDIEFVMEAVIKDWRSMRYASKELKNSKQFLVRLLNRTKEGRILQHASARLRKDEVLVQMFRTLEKKRKGTGATRSKETSKKNTSSFTSNTVKTETVVKQETAAIAKIQSRRSKAGIDAFCAKLPPLADESTGDCAHRCAAVLHYIIKGEELLQLPHQTTTFDVSLTPIVEDGLPSEPVVEIGWSTVNHDLPDNQALWNFFHHQFEFVSDDDASNEGADIEALVAQKRALKPYEDAENLRHMVDFGPGGFVFMPPQKGEGHVGHFILFLRVPRPRERPIKCKPDHDLETFWTGVHGYICDVCARVFKKDSEMNRCEDCDWDICSHCRDTEVQFVDPCRQGEDRHGFDENYYHEQQKLQTKPLFAFSCTSDHIQEQSYLASMQEETGDIKQEGGSLKRQLECLPPGEMVGYQVRLDGATYFVREFDSKEKLFTLESASGTNEKYCTHDVLMTAENITRDDKRHPRSKKQRVA